MGSNWSEPSSEDENKSEAFLHVLYNEKHKMCLRLRIMSEEFPEMPTGFYGECSWLLLMRAKGRDFETARENLANQLNLLKTTGSVECSVEGLDSD